MAAIPWPLIAIGTDFLLKRMDPKGYGGKSDILDPMQFKDELTLTGEDMRDIRQMSLRDIAASGMKNLADIKQMGSTRRLPTGAITSAIQGAGQKSSQAISRIMPSLKMMQKGLSRDFFRTMLPYQQLRSSEARLGGYQDQSSLGALAKIATLWQAGLLNMGGRQPERGMDSTPGILPGKEMDFNLYEGFS